MIITVSPNIAIDRVHIVRNFQAGVQSRAVQTFLQPGGSGVHAATIIQTLSGTCMALGLLGGYTGELWKSEANKRGLIYDMVPIPTQTRESFCLIDLDQGSIVESVEEGPTVDADCLESLLNRLDRYLPQAQMLILSGSLPPGFPEDSYAQMIELAHRYHIRTLADLHGKHLQQILNYGPWLIKPNEAEFHELIGAKTTNFQLRTRACQRLFENTGVIVALSMSAKGLLMTGPEGQWLLDPPRAKLHLPDGKGMNVIGCGDALVGALAHHYCQTEDLLAAARLGLSAAHCNLATFGVPEINAKITRKLAEAIAPHAIKDYQI